MFKALNLDFPTHPANYVQVGEVRGMPLHWQNCATFSMQQAVLAYLNQTPSEHELKMVIAYMKHHIHAPCWLEQSPFGEVNETTAAGIRALRERASQLERVLFLEAADDPEPTRPYQVWVEEITAEGDFPEVERSLAISASDGHWLLADFFGEPKSIWGKLKHEEGLAPVAW